MPSADVRRHPCPQPPLEEPALPANAAYLRTQACAGTWGAVGAVMEQLPLAQYQYYLVLDSSVRGPYVPPYAQHVSIPLAGVHVPATCCCLSVADRWTAGCGGPR